MKISELYIEEFGPLKDLHLSLGDGVTVISGENESGKSTVWSFIKFMLYGLPKRGSAERERSISRGGHRAAGRMVLQLGEECYQIDRSVIEGGRTSEKLQVSRVRDGEPCFVGEVPGEAILGVAREIFENSCCVGQAMCAGVSGKKEATAIQNLLTSADETVEITKIQAKLEEIRVRYRYRRGTGGRLFESEKQINEQRQRLETATENQLRKVELAEKLENNADQLRFCEEKLTEAEAMQKEIGKLEVLRRFDAMRENEKKAEDTRRKRKELSERERKTAYAPTAMDVTSLRLLAESLRRAETALEKAKVALSAAETASVDEALLAQAKQMESDGGRERIMDDLFRANRKKTLGTTLAVVCGILTALGAGLCLALANPLLLSISVVGIAFLVVGILLRGAGNRNVREIARTYGADPEGLAERLALYEEMLTEERKHAEQLLARRAEEAAAKETEAGARAILAEALAKTNAEAEPTVEAAWNEMRRLDAYLKEDTALAQQERTLCQLVENDRGILSPYREDELRAGLTISAEITPEDVARAKRERSAYAEKVRLLRNQSEQLRNELISRGATGEDPMRLADRLDELSRELRADTFYYEAIEGAIEALRQAGETMRGNLTPVIGRNAGSMMDYITDGRYEQMRVASSMNLSLVEKDQALTAAELLSGGTRDAAYLSLRIALMMQIFGEELPPLILDETLCQMDDRRARRMLSLLGKLAEDGLQCLLFTCHRRENQLCREMGLACTEITL